LIICITIADPVGWVTLSFALAYVARGKLAFTVAAGVVAVAKGGRSKDNAGVLQQGP
jgi:hypothetical protein